MSELQIMISQVDNGFVLNVVKGRDCRVLVGDTRETVVKLVESILEEPNETVEVPDSISRSSTGRRYLGPGGTFPKSSEGR